jgi:hypothetical protein
MLPIIVLREGVHSPRSVFQIVTIKSGTHLIFIRCKPVNGYLVETSFNFIDYYWVYSYVVV